MAAKFKPSMLNRTPEQVAVHLAICHKLPFTITNKRVKGWSFIRENIPGNNEYKIEMRAFETITPTDIVNLIGAVKVFQDHRCNVQEDVLGNDKMLTVEIDFYLFLRDYSTHKSKHDMIETLKRLSSFQVFYHMRDGAKFMERYLYNFEISSNEKNVKFIISEKFYELCTKNPWLINYSKLRSLNSQTAKALFLYISGNLRNDFYQSTLEFWLDMKNETSAQQRDNRVKLKSAFKELIAADVISEYEYDPNSKKFILRRAKLSHNKKPKIIYNAIQ